MFNNFGVASLLIEKTNINIIMTYGNLQDGKITFCDDNAAKSKPILLFLHEIPIGQFSNQPKMIMWVLHLANKKQKL